MKSTARVVRCDRFVDENRDFTIHAHRRPWRRVVQAVLMFGPNFTVAEVPLDRWMDVAACMSWLEAMAVLRRDP